MNDPCDFGDLFGGNVSKELREENERLRERVGDYAARLRRISELCLDPAQSHRTITRKEILRLTRGESL